MNQPRDKTCYYCERPYGLMVRGNPLLRTKDHIIPICKEGNNSNLNILYCCHKCNSLKGGDTLDEFIKKLRSMFSTNRTKWNASYLGTVLKNATALMSEIEPYKEKLLSGYKSKKYRLKPQKLPPDQLLPFLSEDWQKRFNKQI